MTRFLCAVLLLATTAAPAFAQGALMGPGSGAAVSHPMPPMGAPPGPPGSPATEADRAAMERMHAGMESAYTGDADRDFVAHMLPHHQGAVDMARVELQYGRDPALKRMARDIVASQEKEIAFMKRWQDAHPQR